MKQFFKFVFASMVGFLLTSIIIFVVVVVLIAALIAAGSEKTTEVEPNSVLQISLNYPCNRTHP